MARAWKAEGHKDCYCQATRLKEDRYARMFNIIRDWISVGNELSTLLLVARKCSTAAERAGANLPPYLTPALRK